MSYKILVTFFFERKLKDLSRKYRKIQSDFNDLIQELEENPFSADRIPGCNGPVFKVRMRSHDMQKGKSGGFRVIYLVKEREKAVYLLTLYPKSERESINTSEINAILSAFLSQTG